MNAELAALRSWCGWLWDQGHLSVNPAARLRSVGRQAQPAPKGLDDRHVNALVREASRSGQGSRDYALVQLLLRTDVRLGACAALDEVDITHEGTGRLCPNPGRQGQQGKDGTSQRLRSSGARWVRRAAARGRAGAGGRGSSVAVETEGHRGLAAPEEPDRRRCGG